MTRGLLLALLLAPGAARAGELPLSVDLTEQFDPVLRDQGKMQTCHAFAAVALLEAARFRRTGERVRLSEADVFVRARTFERVVRDGGLLREDLWSALAEGAALGDHYAPFVARWKAGERRRSELSPEADAAPRLSFSGFVVEGPSFSRFAASTIRTAAKNGPVRCADRSRRRDLLMRVLASGRPVGAGLLLDGMSDPGLAAEAGAWGAPHYLVVTGYETTPAGVVFKTRNSWPRAPRPALSEADMCGLFGLSWLTP